MSSSTTAPPASAFSFSPSCLASTGDTFCTTTQRRLGTPLPGSRADNGHSNLFRQAQFSSDGTTIITQNEDHCLRTFLLPQDLLEPCEQPRQLRAYSTFASSTNIQSYAIYPHFALQDYSTTLVLAASADVPITLRNALDFETVQGSYPFQNIFNEQHRPARTLAFTRNGTHFIAGSDNVVAVFDCTRNGEEPVVEHKLRRSKRAPHVDTWHMKRKGIVSALSISLDGLLALGTTESEIAVYGDDGLGDCLFVFTLYPQSGSGVTDLKWSPDGRYVHVAQRQSDVIDVYDIRNTQQHIATLKGRNAKTSQRMGMDVIQTLSGYEVWAGGTDGIVRMWSNPGSKEGQQEANAQLQLHQAPVSSATWHPTGAVFATCAGERFPQHAARSSGNESDESDDNTSKAHAPDNTLKVWNL